MTTLTSLPQSTLTTFPSLHPDFFRGSTFAIAPLEKKHNANYDNPRLLPSSPASRCLQLPLRILRCGSPSYGRISGRSGRVSHRTVTGRGCHSCRSLSDETLSKPNSYEGSISRTITCTGVYFPPDSVAFDRDSLHRGADLTTQQGWMSATGQSDLLQERSSVDESVPWVSLGSDISPNITTVIPQRLHAGVFSKWAALMKMAVLASVLGLQTCSQAWAGPEVAQVNLNSTFDLGDFSDIQSGFASAFLLIFFSEIGDKTFFIAALLATRKSGVAVFSGTFGALTIMTVISVFLGRIFHYIDAILPSFGNTKLPVDDIAAVLLLIYFGVSTLLEAASMEGSESGEEQQEAELAIAGVGTGGAMVGTVATTFALVFVAEWGDKSFFSTIALAAASSPLGVVTGAIAGHGAATLVAVLGGSFLGNYVSEKVIAYIGGVLFLVFAGVTLAEILN